MTLHLLSEHDARLLADDVEAELEDNLPGYAWDTLCAALTGGDVGEAVVAAPNEFRGLVAVLFHSRLIAGLDTAERYRQVLEPVWSHDHRTIIGAAGENRDVLRAMFRDAAFPLPDWMPETVRIWRGTPECRRGPSWTVRREVACWFAMRFDAIPGHRPTVLTTKVPRSALLHWSDERREGEVVCLDTDGATVDGTPDDWRTGMLAYNEASVLA